MAQHSSSRPSPLSALASTAILTVALACSQAGSPSTPAASPSTEASPAPAATAAPPAAAADPAPPRAPEAPAANTPAPIEGAVAASPATRYDADPAAQKRGLDLFRAVCTGYCHSTSAKVQKDASYLFDCDATHGREDQQVYDVIVNGIPDTRMQGFGGKLPEDDIWKLVSFLRVRSKCAQG